MAKYKLSVSIEWEDNESSPALLQEQARALRVFTPFPRIFLESLGEVAEEHKAKLSVDDPVKLS